MSSKKAQAPQTAVRQQSLPAPAPRQRSGQCAGIGTEQAT